MSLYRNTLCIECNERLAVGSRLYCHECGYDPSLIKKVKRMRKKHQQKRGKDGIKRPFWYTD